MKTALFAKTQTEISPYIAVYKETLTAKGWLNEKTGIVNKFPTEHKVLWCYMLDRYEFFKSNNKQWFDDQTDIGDACGISRSTVQRFLKLLNEAGVVLITSTRQYGGHISNSYVITRDLVLVHQDKKTAPAEALEQPLQAIEATLQSEPPVDDIVLAGSDWASEAVPIDAYEEFVPELDDDGTRADSFSYSEQSEVQEAVVAVQETKPVAIARPGIETVDLTTLPEICYERNGSINNSMWDWLEDRGFYIEDPKDCIVQLNGNRYMFKARQFELCNSAVEEEAFSPF